MGDVNSERARREAAEHVGNTRPTEGENRVQAAMRRYLGASYFHDTEAEPRPTGEKPKKDKAEQREDGAD
jgi:hypothetical protein